MLKYISWIVFFIVAAFGLTAIKKSASTTFNDKHGSKNITRSLRRLAGLFVASLIAVCMVFINFGAIREYLFSVLPEQTIDSAYAIIKILFGAPSVTYALNSLCIYFVIGSSISAVCVISADIIMHVVLTESVANEKVSEGQYKIVLKQSYFNTVSFISLRKIRI